MRLAELDAIRENAIRFEMNREREERAEAFRRLVEEFNAYEEAIGDSTKGVDRDVEEDNWKWIDPQDKRIKKVKSAGGSVANIIASAELREMFL